MKRVIALNLKVYSESFGEKGVELAEVVCGVSESFPELRFILCVNAIDLRLFAEKLIGKKVELFSQHVDSNESGAFTGSIPVEFVKEIGCKGSLVNHSEKKIGVIEVGKAVALLKENGLDSIACADDIEEAKAIACLSPNASFIAVEPPELIGKGVSVSTARPEVVRDSVEVIKGINSGIGVLCGAGVSSASDVRKAIDLGVDGVLLSSAFVKSRNPSGFLRELAQAFY